MREPTVAVVIPTYDRPQFVLDAVESVLAQDPLPARIIVVDDGVTPCPQPKLRDWATTGRIQLIQEGNRGLPRARNRGAREATTDFLLFLDDDDMLAPGALAALRDALVRYPSAVGAAGGGQRYFASRQQLGEVEWPGDEWIEFGDLTRTNPFFVGAVMMRRSAFEAAGGFTEDVPLAEDWDLWLRLARIGRFTLPRVAAVTYRVHGGNMSRTSRVAKLAFTTVRHHLRQFSPSGRHQYSAPLAAYLTNTYLADVLWHCRVALRRGQFRVAVKEAQLCLAIALGALPYPSGRAAIRSAARQHLHS